MGHFEIGFPRHFYVSANSPDKYNQNSSQNWAVVQDNRGIVYFGNNDGILEFDGVNWRLIKTRKNLHVRSLAVDQSGNKPAGAALPMVILF